MPLRNLMDVFGEFDLVDRDVPPGYAHIHGVHQRSLLKRLGIDFLRVRIGSRRVGRDRLRQLYDGVLVAEANAPRLLDAIARLDVQHARRRLADWISTATGWARRGDLAAIRRHYLITAQRAEIEARRVALRRDDDEWYARNSVHLNYDWDRHVPETWPDYLAMYRFPHRETAKRIAAMLLDTQTTHPAEFCAAVLGAVFYDVVPANYSAFEACKKWERFSRLQYRPRRDGARRDGRPF